MAMFWLGVALVYAAGPDVTAAIYDGGRERALAHFLRDIVAFGGHHNRLPGLLRRLVPRKTAPREAPLLPGRSSRRIARLGVSLR